MEPKIGVYICHCGTNIAGTVDVEAVTEFARELPSVAIARHYMYMCSDPGQDLIRQDIKKLGVNRVVVAACSPTLHERTYRRVCQESGLNPYLFEMANIREHCSWITEDRGAATEKAKALVSAAVRRVAYQEPLETRGSRSTPIPWWWEGALLAFRRHWRLPIPGIRSTWWRESPALAGIWCSWIRPSPPLIARLVFSPRR